MANTKSPVSLLQEVLVKHGSQVPIYQEKPSDLPQFPFKCTVLVGTITADGYAHTKKEAKQNSAKEVLLKLGVGLSNSNKIHPVHLVVPLNGVNYTGKLHEYASGNRLPYPTYCEKSPQNGWFLVECQFLGMTAMGIGTTKQNAKQEASKKMLEE